MHCESIHKITFTVQQVLPILFIGNLYTLDTVLVVIDTMESRIDKIPDFMECTFHRVSR